MSLTRQHVGAAFRLFERAGIRRPDCLVAPPQATAEATAAATRELALATADVWVAVLGDLTEADFMAACLAHLREPNAPGQWAKPWPDTGRIRALVPARQVAALDDADLAWRDLVLWLETDGLARRNPANGTRGNPRPLEVDPDDPPRDEAIREALSAIGGATGWASCPTVEAMGWLKKEWLAAYRVARTRVRVVAEAARLAGLPALRELAERPAPALPARPGPNDSGFRRMGE